MMTVCPKALRLCIVSSHPHNGACSPRGLHYHLVLVPAGLPALWSDGAPGATTIDEDISIAGAEHSSSAPGTLDADDFAGAIRRLAIDADRTLNRPDTTAGELVKLRRRIKELLQITRGLQRTGIDRWLRSADRLLESRLFSDLRSEPGHLAS